MNPSATDSAMRALNEANEVLAKAEREAGGVIADAERLAKSMQELSDTVLAIKAERDALRLTRLQQAQQIIALESECEHLRYQLGYIAAELSLHDERSVSQIIERAANSTAHLCERPALRGKS